MKAGVITPGVPNSYRVADMAEPDGRGRVLFRPDLIGICGTDQEIVSGLYGEAPPGDSVLILGHEVLATVQEVPPGSRLRPGDRVVPIVRRPCDHCYPCSLGQWDQCQSGDYTERGIKGRHGSLSELAAASEDFLVKVKPAVGDAGVLVEPGSVVAKALRQAELAQRRLPWVPHTALVTGAGPIGLLATLLLSQRGYAVTVLDQVDATSGRALAAKAVGASYAQGSQNLPAGALFDLVIEATGFSPLVFEAAAWLAPGGAMVLTGVTGGHRQVVEDTNQFNQRMVLHNQLMVGSVNAGRQDYLTSVAMLERAATEHPGWTAALITRRVAMADFASGLDHQPTDVKVVVTVATA
ncbi:MAG: glucose 1-dehydrogenase [Sulfobacillus sp.]